MIAEQLDGVRQVTLRLFSALRANDAAAASRCYHRDAVLSAPIVGVVRGADIGSFWHFIFGTTRDLSLRFDIVDLGLTSARVEGVFSYSLIESGRRVAGPFQSVLNIRDRKVVLHDDTFDPWAWAQMTFGPAGLVLGWSRAWQRGRSLEIRDRLSAYRS